MMVTGRSGEKKVGTFNTLQKAKKRRIDSPTKNCNGNRKKENEIDDGPARSTASIIVIDDDDDECTDVSVYEVTATDSKQTKFGEKDTVKILEGEYSGKIGTIIEVYPECAIVKIGEDGVTRLLPTVHLALMVSVGISSSPTKAGNRDNRTGLGTKIPTKTIFSDWNSKSLVEADTKELDSTVDSKASAIAADRKSNEPMIFPIESRTIEKVGFNKDNIKSNITNYDKISDIDTTMVTNTNEKEGMAVGMDAITPKSSRTNPYNLRNRTRRVENKKSINSSNDDNIVGGVIEAKNLKSLKEGKVTNINNDDYINESLLNEEDGKVLGMEVVLPTGGNSKNRKCTDNGNKDNVYVGTLEMEGIKSLNGAGTVSRNNSSIGENEHVGAFANLEEDRVPGIESIRASSSFLTSPKTTHNNSSEYGSAINNKQLTTYQPAQPSEPPPEVGSVVVIIEGIFKGYQGIVVEDNGEEINQEQYQDRVFVQIFNDDQDDDSKSIVMTNSSRLIVTKNVSCFLKERRLRLISNQPTRSPNLMQITKYGEQSWDHYHSSSSHKNQIDERNQQYWDKGRVVDPACRFDRATSQTSIYPDNYKDSEMAMGNGDEVFFDNQSDGEKYCDIEDNVFHKGNQTAVKKKGISSNCSKISSPLPAPSSLDKQNGDDNDDIVFYNGSQAAVQERKKDRIKIFLIDGTERWVKKDELDNASSPKNRKNIGKSVSSCVGVNDDDDICLHANDEHWRIPGFNDGGMRFSGQLVRHCRLGEIKEETFLDFFLKTRKQIVIKDFDNEQMKLPIERVAKFADGNVYEIISTKVVDESGAASLFNFSSPRILNMIYVQTSGPNVEPVNVQDLLSRIADFGSLTPRKMVARLELFQSPSWAMDSTLQLSDFQEIPEEGHIGCGFIGESMLKNLLLRHAKRKRSVSNTVADITICIQVRLFVPSLGVFKGVLMKKQIPAGSPQIQLPPSMKKIGPSRSKNPIKGAFLVINRAGLDPSDNSKMIGRIPHIDPHSPNACPKSFTPIMLNDMILRMFSGLGASKESTYGYFKRSKKRDGLEHAFVRGVIDPTGKLPPGTVFLSGTKNCKEVINRLFVTRSPCLKYNDARMLPVVTSKPDALSLLEWNWLNKLPFGVLIFSLPKEGMKSLPEYISNGDLDGDRYFVCWNREILEQINADPIVDMPSTDPDVINPKSVASENNAKEHKEVNANWLSQAQKHMCTTFVDTQKMNQLIGCLYKTAQATSDKYSLRHQDVTDYAIAFGQALDNAKHGGRVELPKHLYFEMRPNLRELLTIKKSKK